MKPRHIALAIFISALWGFNFVAAKWGVNEFPPIWFTGLRFLLVGLLLAPWLRLPRGQMRRVLAITLFAGALHFSLMFTGLKLATDVATVAIVAQLGVPFATVLAVFLLGERIRWRRITGIATAFLGVMVMGVDPRVLSYIDAVLLIVAAAFFMALSQVMMRDLGNVGVFNLQAWIALVSAPMLFALSLLVESNQIEAMAAASSLAWGMVAYTAIAASVIGHGGIYYLISRYPVSLVTPIFTLSPLFGVACGVAILGDVLTARMMAGGAMTILGVLIVTLREPRTAVRPVD